MIFKTIDEFQEYLPVNTSLTLDLMRSHIITAEQRWLRHVLGKDLLNQLQADYDASSTDPAHLALLDVCRKAVAPLGFNLYAPYSQVQISDAGWTNIEGDNRKPAYRWQAEKIEEASLLQGMMALEEVLLFLEENQADYPLWDYASTHSRIINSVDEFEEAVSIDGSRMIFIKLLPHIDRAQKQLAGVMGKEQLAELLTAISTQALTPALESLWDYARQYVACEAFSKAVVGLPVRFDGNYVRVYASQFPGGSDFAPMVNAEMPTLSAIAQLYAQRADTAKEELRDFLYENVADYPLFEASKAYTPEGPAVDERDSSKGGWFFA